MTNFVGQVILNRYSVREFLGSGGMAEVYKVWDNQRNSYLAMKVLHEKLAQSSLFLEHFRQEAETLSQLTHPNIVRFYGFEQDQARSYILMDFIEGQTLKDKIKNKNEKPFQAEEISELLSPVLVALQFAHNKGLIHCDIKPANIMVDSKGTVLLTDFGIARASYLDSHSISSSGTPSYMAPEQVLNQAPVPETDIYALGVVLFEMLTGGQRPFNGTQAQVGGHTGEKIRWEQLHLFHPSPYRWNPVLNPALKRILDQCLSKEISQRYRSALDLLNALNVVDETVMGQTSAAIEQEEPKVASPQPIRKQPSLKKASKKKTDNKLALWMVAVFFIASVGLTFMAIFSSGGGSDFGSGGGSASTPTQKIPVIDTPAEETRTPFAQFLVRSYEKYRDQDAILLHSPDVETLTKPGYVIGDVDFPANKKAHLLFGWCATEQEILRENLSHIRDEILIDGQSISLTNFTVVEAEDARGLWCKSYSAVVSGWIIGTHTIIHTQHFATEINDGIDIFPAGGYITEYVITVR